MTTATTEIFTRDFLLRLSPVEDDLLRAIAASEKRPVSAVIRTALEMYAATPAEADTCTTI
jgi:hypothetical protein